MLPFWELYPLLSHWCIAILHLLCDHDGDSKCENMQQQFINIISISQSAILLTTKIIDHRGDSSGIFGGLPISTNKSCHQNWYLLLLGLPGSGALPRGDGTQHLRQLPPAAQRGEFRFSWHHLRACDGWYGCRIWMFHWHHWIIPWVWSLFTLAFKS